jgi:serine/threonine protein kinase
LIVANADRIIELLHEAKARPAGAERERFLTAACGDDAALKEQIVSLLKADADEGKSDFLKNTLLLRPSAPVTEKSGDRIGRYKLLEQIGEGGCGVVYMADQEEPVRRRVALKVVKLGMDTKQVIARFEAERQALAMMDHPNIAKVLDAGATDTGRPFFVMELVRGIRITDYCDQNNLSTNERLKLFIQVCQAIQHAHQKGIIHRDIKPSNILVTQNDHVAVPKVIDFGIAKATIGHLTDKTLFTAFAQFMGTPAYMSPEQAQMSGLDIDTRADIYSLGVLLYELLTGNTPFDAKALLAAGMDEMCRKIREDEPAKPSTCLSTMLAMDLTIVAKHRHVEPPRLIHLLRGDLDWLVMKCLEKDRTRRYATANGLAVDIQRHLNSEPVEATPPGIVYVTRKLLRRRRKEITVAVLLLAAVAFAGTIGLQYIEAKVSRRNFELSQLRREESTSLDRVIAGLALTEPERNFTRARVSHLASRVKAGLGSDADHELLARFLTREVRLSGRLIQTIGHSSMTLSANTGRGYPVNEVGIILRPLVALDGTELKVDGYPAYLSGGSSGNATSGYGGDVHVEGAAGVTGMRVFSCILEAQLVHAEGTTSVRSRVQSGDYQAIGTAVRIVLPAATRCFLRQLPSDYPIEVVDNRAAQRVAEGVVFSDCRVTVDKARGCTLDLDVLVPRLSPPLPLALQVDLVQLGKIPLHAWVCGLVVDENDLATIVRGDSATFDDYSISSDSEGNCNYHLKFLLSGIKAVELGVPPSSAQIIIHSSREIALRCDALEHFLSIPETRKSFTIAVEEARNR